MSAAKGQIQVKSTLSDAATFIKAIASQMAATKKYGEPVMLHSPPGVGKSASVFQVADEIKDLFEKAFDAKFKVWDVRIGAMPEYDIQGIPFPATVGIGEDGIELKDMFYSTPSWFPREGECGILFTDEISNAAIPNQHAAYRLLHDRSIHNGRKLPEGVLIVGAGNSKEDKTGAKGLIPALARRFQTHFYIEPNLEEFISHGMRKQFHHSVLAFLQYDASMLYRRPDSGELGFPCPANWESISKMMSNPFLGDLYATDPDIAALVNKSIYGAIGHVAGQEYIGFLKNEAYLPNFKKVRETGEYEKPSIRESDRGIMFSIITSTALQILNCLNDDEVPDEETNNLGAILQQFDPSSAGVAFRSMRRADKSAISKIMFGASKYPTLTPVFKSVLDRTKSMA